MIQTFGLMYWFIIGLLHKSILVFHSEGALGGALTIKPIASDFTLLNQILLPIAAKPSYLFTNSPYTFYFLFFK